MSTQNIIRAWKDKAYRESLSEAELALLPESPAGLIELGDAELDQVAGGTEGTTSPTCKEASVILGTLYLAACPSVFMYTGFKC